MIRDFSSFRPGDEVYCRYSHGRGRMVIMRIWGGIQRVADVLYLEDHPHGYAEGDEGWYNIDMLYHVEVRDGCRG